MKLISLWLRVASLLACLLPTLAVADIGGASFLDNSIVGVQVSKSNGAIVVRLNLRKSLEATPPYFSIANPARLVFDLPNTGNGLGFQTKAVNEGNVRSFNVVQVGDRSRFVLNLDKMTRFELHQEDKALQISLLGGEADAGAVQHFVGNDKKEGQDVRDIKFRRGKDGAAIVAVDLTASDTGIDIHQKGTKLNILFKKTKLPDHLRRRLDVVDFSTPVTEINTRMAGEDTVMEISPKGLWEHVAFQSDNQFIVEVRPLKEDPNKLFQGTKAGYQGEAISLNFQSIPLRELLHVFADITNFNIVVSDTVTGNVSLRLNDVPWDQALEIVLQQKNLAMRKNGNVLWVAPRDELAARDKMEVEARDAAVAAEMPRMEVFQLNYQKAEDFVAMLAASAGSQAEGGSQSGGFLSPIGKVTIDKRTNQAFIYDVPSKLELIRGLLTKIDRPARQVLIEARIVEASDSFSKSLGARLGVHDYRGADVGHKILGNNSPRFAIGGVITDPGAHTGQVSGTPDFLREATSVNLPASSIGGAQTGAFSLILFNSAKTQFLNMELSALEADGRGKIISSPRVVTADQIEASIEQGTEIPYLQASSSGAANVAYKKAVLSLKVKPQITPDGRIIMKLQIHKDAPNPQYSTNYGIAIDTKNVNTDVLIENGGTVVIGGIYAQDERESTTRIPVLGDLPYVGFMFRKKERQDNRTELLVFITPKIVSEIAATY